MHVEQFVDDFTARDWQDLTRTEQPVRFAMVGLGWWTVEKAIPAAEESALCTPTVVVSGSTEKAESVVADSDVECAITYDEFENGAATDAYDAVYIATPNDTHLDFTAVAARHGKDVLCEKPMEVTGGRAQRMIDVCEDNDVTLMIAYRMQVEPVVRRARELLAADAVGTVTQIHSHISIRLLDVNPDTDQWKLDAEHGGGAMFGNGVYPLNTTRFLLDADPVAVQATAWSPDDPFANVDEHVAFQLEYPDDVVASCSASHNTFDVSHLKVLGTAGELTLEPIFHPWEPRTLTLTLDGVETSFTVEDVDQMVEEFEYFSECVLTGREPGPDGDHGRQDVEYVKRVHEAAERGDRLETR